MVQNVGRKLVLIGVLLVASILLLTIPDQPVPLGLDLAGGSRLVYSIPIDEARESGAIGDDETDDQVLEETIAIIRNRVDPEGITNPIIRRAGGNRIEVAIPGDKAVGGTSAVSTLQAPVPPTGSAPILLEGDNTSLVGFPGGGGVVRIGGEDIRYQVRVNNELRDVTRAVDKTVPGAHDVGAGVTLISDDAIRNAIENLGDLRFYPAATAPDFTRLGTDQITAENRVKEWLARPENAGVPIKVYNSLVPEQGGPPTGIQWFPHALPAGVEPTPVADRLLAVTKTPPEWTFTGADLARVGKGQDQTGYPAVTFEMGQNARVPFGEFTEQYEGKVIAIVLNDEVVSAPVINEALYGQSQIAGRFSQAEVDSLVTVLRSGSLKIKPVLESQETVGATLGADYVRRGWQGALVALSVTLLFMLVYYRRLGAFACIALLANLVMLMGAMVLLQGTLTLPGIAGIILTVGMAVDANILIFDRMREEAEKGRKPIQAAKDGFGNALSAIVDANVTTFLTAVILYKVGTGPIRGFAVTLMIGILTSLFAALMITRVLVHLQIERGVERFSMARWMADAKFEFLSKARFAVPLSIAAVVLSVGYFAWLPDNKKLGIDFLGGASGKVRVEQAMTTEEMRDLIAKIPGDIGSSDVVALPAAAAGDGRYLEFRITYKTDSGEAASAGGGGSEGAERLFASEIKTALADVLQKGPIEAALVSDGARNQANVALYFEEPHSVADVQQVLTDFGLTELQVAHRGQQQNVFDVSGSAPPGLDANLVKVQLSERFSQATDSANRAYTFSQPVPETSVIGSQVVGELRDSAIQALLLSIFLVIIYIRVRFAEYSYGIAAVAAVVHDVLIILGTIALLVTIPFIHVEMDLTMIAAFLTVLGYSLNDTIVIFDRVRENLPRMKGSFAEIVNVSINQTLSRTIVTSGTTLVTLLIVLSFNFGTGNALEGFAFALTVGIITGTYSTIYIACPLLVWLEERNRRKALAAAEADSGRGVPAPGKP